LLAGVDEMHFTYRRGSFTITTNPETFDLDVIHRYLTHSYWRRGVPKEHVARAVKHSLAFGLFHDRQQIGFARVVTDYADFAYLSDVFVLESYQGQGLGYWLVDCILNCPTLQGLGKIALDTVDAQEFYRKFGFSELIHCDNHMQLRFQRPWFIPDE
jgi:GNAT superfamily N-acetyltransferase